MPITVNTEYTKERMLRYSDFAALSRKWFWAVMGGCTVLVIACLICLGCLGAEITDVIRLCVFLTLAMDGVVLFTSFVLPRILIPKSKQVGTAIHSEFYEDRFELSAVNSYIDEKATVRYDMITTVKHKGDDVYLYISPRQAYIVDVSALSNEERRTLRTLLAAHINTRKLLWFA